MDELGHETLWTVCTMILLCIVVSSLISLIFSCSTSIDQVVDEKLNHASTIDHDHDNNKEKKKKNRVEFVDPVSNLSQVNVINSVEFGTFGFVGISNMEENEGIEGKNLCDEGEILVGFDFDGHQIREISGNIGDLSDRIDGFEGERGNMMNDQREEEENTYKDESSDVESGEDELYANVIPTRKDGEENIYESSDVEFGEDELYIDVTPTRKDGEENIYKDVSSGVESGEDELYADITPTQTDGEDCVDKSDELNKPSKSNSIYLEKIVLSDDGDEEWEGIERNELEKEFVEAMEFVEFRDKEGKVGMVGDDVKIELYGLQKVAMEGPCHEPQPMALKLITRAKWNAWQRLGNMNPEEAMEQYIALLSKHVQGWTKNHSSTDKKPDSSEESLLNLTPASITIQ